MSEHAWKPSASLIAAKDIVAQLERESPAADTFISQVFAHRMVEVIALGLDTFSKRVPDAPKSWQHVPNGVDVVVLTKEEAEAALIKFPGLDPEEARLQYARDKKANGDGKSHFVHVSDLQGGALGGLRHGGVEVVADTIRDAKSKRRGPKGKKGKKAKPARSAAAAAV